jgi:hypothetical protein
MSNTIHKQDHRLFLALEALVTADIALRFAASHLEAAAFPVNSGKCDNLSLEVFAMVRRVGFAKKELLHEDEDL